MFLGLYATEYGSDRSALQVPRGRELLFLKNLESYFNDAERQERLRTLSFLLDTNPNPEWRKLPWWEIPERGERGFIPLDSSFFVGDTFDPNEIDKFISFLGLRRNQWVIFPRFRALAGER